MAVFLLIGKTSALTMNVAGVIKDWLLILLSVVMFECVWASVGWHWGQAFDLDLTIRQVKVAAGGQGPAFMNSGRAGRGTLDGRAIPITGGEQRHVVHGGMHSIDTGVHRRTARICFVLFVGAVLQHLPMCPPPNLGAALP